MTRMKRTRSTGRALLAAAVFISLAGVARPAPRAAQDGVAAAARGARAQDCYRACKCEECCLKDPHCGCCTDSTDLSGSYEGRVTLSGGHEMSGEGTLTITGNTFQLESGGTTHGGRVYAVTTRGYTGASFYFTDLIDPATGTPVVAAVRARKSGDRLILSPVPGARIRMTFTSGGGARRRR